MPFRVTNVTRGKILADKAENAQPFYSRFMGLMGVTDLPFGAGLHIKPCNSIHTFFMRIPIDALFLDAEGRIVRLLPAMVPWRVSSIYSKAKSVLELPAGTAQASGTVEGDLLTFEVL